jgi:O-antigen ligase
VTPTTRALPGLLAFAAVVGLGFDNGGFFSRSWSVAAAVLLWVVLLTAILRRPGRPRRSEIAWVVLLASFVGWTALSLAWSVRGSDTVYEVRRDIVYVLAAAAFLLLIDAGSVEPLVAGVWAGAAVVVSYAVARYLLDPGYRDPAQDDLLSLPVGYANALALLAGMGALLAVGLALRATNRALRAAAVVSVLPFGAAIVLASSRATLLAVAVGLAAAVVLDQRRVRTAAAVLGAGALTAVVIAAAVWGSGFFATGVRPQYWHVAWREYAAHPWLGSGAGTFAEYWLREGDPSLAGGALDAHNLYLETLAEVGPIGLALLAAALLLPLWPAVVARRHPLVPAAAGAYVALLAHAALDWDWEMPVLFVAGIACAAACWAAARARTEPRAWGSVRA